MKRKVLVFIFAAFLSAALHAQDSETKNHTEQSPATETKDFSEFYGLKISSINFLGLKKTKDIYLQPKVKKLTGTEFSKDTLVELEKILQIEGLFDEISFNVFPVSESEASIEVFVNEKLSFLLLPFASFSSSGLLGGVMAFDRNAFGMKDTFLAGGILSKNSQSGMFAFSKSPKENFIPGFSVSLYMSHDTKKIQVLEPYDSDDIILQYKATTFSASASLKEKLSENTSASLGFTFSTLREKDIRGYEDIVDSIKIGSIHTDLEYSKSDWNGWFTSTAGARLSAKLSFSNDRNYQYAQTYSARVGFQKPILPRLRLLSQISGTIGKNNHISNYSGRGAISSTIISDKFVSQRLFGSSAGLEFAPAKLKFGIISVYSNYEAIYVQDYDGKYKFNQGFNFGSKLYLSKIAIPALSLGLAYNITQKKMYYAFSLGVAM